MSNAKWRPSTSAANVSQSASVPVAAELQSVLDRLKQRPSLLATQTALSTGSSPRSRDVHESRSRSPRRDASTQLRGSARCRSSTGVTPWLPGGSGRQSSTTPRSAERRRSRYSDVTEPGERLPLTDRSNTRRDRRPDTSQQSDDAGQKADDSERRTDSTTVGNDVGEHATNTERLEDDASDRAADTAERRSSTTPRRGDAGDRGGAAGAAAGRVRRHLAPADTSQSALSSSADSSLATSTTAALTPDTGTQSSLTGGSPVRLTPHPAASPPAGSAARQFQARPRRDPTPDPARPDPAERPAEGGGRRPAGIPPIVRKTLMDFDRIQKLKYAAETAMREKKVFMIHGGYPSIRLALKRRGWVEKKYLINRSESEDEIDVSRWPIDTDSTTPITIGLADVLGLKGSKNSMILTRLLKDHQPNLIWSAKREVIDYVSLERDQLVNHFPRAPFNTKVGLCSLAQNLHWYSEALSADTFLPRAFRIALAEEKLAFVEDFRLTACAGLLLWFKERYELHGTDGVEDADGEVPYSVIPTALQQCQAYIATREHEDIEPTAFSRALWPHQWDNFLTNVYKVVHRAKKLQKHRDENSTIVKVFYNRITQLLAELTKYRPQTMLDGWLNIWIVKPGSSSRGRGIILLRQLEDVLALVDSATQREGKYVVQKYVERPMLIYNTKFDIRQWFLVTDWNPLTVWMYKQSYLRFCSQQFTLEELKEAVHLCNNAIQARYRNGERHAALPTENMWDSSTFQQFLKSREAGHAWEQIIYPAMKSAIISLCLASQTELEPRRGCFELFGADFLLTEDFHPWLIEVNSSPAMGASTSVTAWLCAMCLEDVIRVIVDRRRDSQADVGEFECILQQPAVSSPRYLGIDLSVHGHRLKPPAGAAPPAGPEPPSPAAGPEAPAAPRSPPVASSAAVRTSEVATRLTSLSSPAAVPAVSQTRRRSRSQASPAGPATPPQSNSSVSGAVPAGRRAAQPPPPPPPAAAQKPRQRVAGRKPAVRRRSRTQLIQSSVRRLSDPRRPRSGQQRRSPGTVPVPVQPAVCPVPRSGLPLAGRRREPPSPRAQQLVTCDRLAERPGSAAGEQRRGAALSSAGVSGPLVSSSSLQQQQQQQQRDSGQQRAEEPADAPSTEPTGQEPESQPTAETSPPIATSRFVSSSLDKLEKIRRSSSDAVRRINSLSLAPAAAGGAEAASSVQEVHMRQTGKVKWVAMPAGQTSQPPHPPPRFPAQREATVVTRTASPTAAARTVSPVSRAPFPRAGTPPPRGAVTLAPRFAGPAGPVSRTVSPQPAPCAAPLAARPASDSASWSAAGGQSAVPSPAGGGAGSGLLPALNLTPAAHPPAAFNTRITELKTLIDRAIEETREFLGRSRGTPRAAPLLPAEPAAVAPSPRPCLSPTIVDIAVRRPAGSSVAWEASDPARLSPARSSPRRGSPAPAPALARPEPARLTELVGLQGRRFLPQLSPPEPAPRRSR